MNRHMFKKKKMRPRTVNHCDRNGTNEVSQLARRETLESEEWEERTAIQDICNSSRCL